MSLIIRIFANCIELAVFVYFCFQLLEFKHKRNTFILVSLIIELIKFFVIIMNHPVYNFVSSMVLYGSLILFMFKGKLSLKIFLICMFLCLSVSVEELSFSMMQVLRPDLKNISFIMEHTALLLLATVLSSTLLFIFSNTVVTILKAKVDEVILFKDVIMLMLLPISTIMIIISMHFPFGFVVKSNLLLFASELILLLANITVCNILKQKLEENKHKLEFEHLQNSIRISQMYFDMTQDKVKQSKKIRHDYKKQLQLLNGLIQQNEYEKVKNYLGELLDYQNENRILISGNQILDLMIDAHYDEIIKNNISLQLNIQKFDLNQVKINDLSTIYGNILDNAIESCMICEDKYNEITFKQIGSYYILRFTNSCCYVNNDNGTFITTKSKDYHGFGLINIKETVEKYEGSVDFKYDEDENVFISTIRFKVDRVC